MALSPAFVARRLARTGTQPTTWGCEVS